MRTIMVFIAVWVAFGAAGCVAWRQPQPAAAPAQPAEAVTQPSALQTERDTLAAQNADLRARADQLAGLVRELREETQLQKAQVRDLAGALRERDQLRARVAELEAQNEYLRTRLKELLDMLRGNPPTRPAATQPATP